MRAGAPAGRRVFAAGSLVAILVAAVPGLARAQWAPLHPGKHHAPPPSAASPTPPAPEAAGELPDRGAARTLLVPSLVAGWWGFGRAEGAGFDGTLSLGLRLEAEPLSWLPVELLAVYGGRDAGTPMVSTSSTYVSVVALAGWQFVHGMGVYGVEAGVAGTFQHATHQVVDGAPQTVDVSGFAFGPAWTLDMRLRLGPLEARVDVGSVWRGGQADLLVLAGVGLRLPVPSGE